MNIAIIFAGGVGQRMNAKALPKQFLEVHGKPVIIYTLEHFENHPDIDHIIVVCVEGWIDYLQSLLKKFYITKVSAIVPGGDTGQHSIRNGIYKAAELYPEDSIVLIHDGVRPLITAQIITDCIDTVKKHGNAITVSRAIETIVISSTDQREDVADVVDRSRCMMARAPQCFVLRDIYAAHKKMDETGYTNIIDSAMLMREFGMTLHTVEGVPENIKITTPADFYMFRALLDARENSQIICM